MSQLSNTDVTKLTTEFFSKIQELRRSKSNDYATSADGLKSFRTAAARAGITMPQVWMALVGKHLSALENDVQNPNLTLNEGLKDRLLDVANYCSLLYAIAHEGVAKFLSEANGQSAASGT